MAWDESKHPRVPKGSPSGGEFTSKGSTQSTSKAEKLKEARGIYDSDSYSMPFTGRANELVKWAKENGVELPLFPDGSLDVARLEETKAKLNCTIAGIVKGKPMTFEEADNGNVNPGYNGGKNGYSRNCQTCVATYYARRLGYNVRALPFEQSNEGMAELAYSPELMYIDSNGDHPRYSSPNFFESTTDFLSRSVKNGEICTIQYVRVGRNSGHIVIAEKDDNGTLKIYDPQNNTVFLGNEIASMFRATYHIALLKLSGCDLNIALANKIMEPATGG